MGRSLDGISNFVETCSDASKALWEKSPVPCFLRAVADRTLEMVRLCPRVLGSKKNSNPRQGNPHTVIYLSRFHFPFVIMQRTPPAYLPRADRNAVPPLRTYNPCVAEAEDKALP